MPLQNRVTPLGELVADPVRGLVYGNRGCLLLQWTPGGYGQRVARGSGAQAELITPSSLVAVLREGWNSSAVPLLHPTARR